MADETKQERRERLARDLDNARDRIRQLQGEIAFADVVDGLSEAVAGLPQMRSELERLRARGYAFRGDLERDLAAASEAAGPTLESVREEIQRAEGGLRREARAISRAASKITGDPLREKREIAALESRVEGFGDEVEALESRLEAMVEPVKAQLQGVADKTRDLHWTLDRFDGATFQLQPTERPVAAAEATWTDAPGGEEPEGLLLFTDHRVYFEQDEEKVTKRKFLFFTAEKERLHKKLLDEPIGHLEDSQDSTKGMVFKDQLLTFTWAGQANTPRQTTFELKSGTASDWDAVVELIRAGDLDRDLADASTGVSAVPGAAPPPAAAHEVRWPERCQSCSATLTAPVKGQTSIVCEYCGADHAVEFVTP